MNSDSASGPSWTSHHPIGDKAPGGRNVDMELSQTGTISSALDDGTDEDHLLSYFLDTEASDGGGGGTPISLHNPPLSVALNHQNKLSTSTSNSNINDMNNPMNVTTSTAASTVASTVASNSIASSTSSSSLLGQSPSTLQRKSKQTNGFEMPSTPAVQFYASSNNTLSSQKQPESSTTLNASAAATTTTQQQQQQMQPQLPQFPHFSAGLHPGNANSTNSNTVSSSSSSSSLSSIANALVHGNSTGHIIQVQQQFQAQGIGNNGSTASEHRFSPISPAGLINNVGSGEQMMLPPASRVPTISSVPPSSQASNHVKYQPMVSQRLQMNMPANNKHTTTNDSINTMNNTQMQIPSSSSSLQVAHMEWLKQMNQIASATHHSTTSENMMSASSFVPNSSVQPMHVEQPQSQHHQSNVNKANTNSLPVTLPVFTQTSQNTTPLMTQQQQQQQQQLFLQSMHRSRMLNTDILPSAPTASMIARLQSQFAKEKESSATESKEKRERRLARNRESARQSRRRKKELLLNLGAQVSKLQQAIDVERFRQLECMERELVVDRIRIIEQLFSSAAMSLGVSPDAALSEQLVALIRLGGPNSQIRRAAVDYQYNALNQTILSYSQHFMLALLMKDETFFTLAKEQRAKTIKTTGRVSSKQVGEELTNGMKEKMNESVVSGGSGSNSSSRSPITCHHNDRYQMWPLLCYELAVSLDQEEKLLQYMRRLRDNQQLEKTKRQLSIATTMVSNMKNGVLYQSHATAHRNEAALLQALTPPQSARFLQWFLKNKERCKKVFGHHNYNNRTHSKVVEEQSGDLNGQTDVDQSMINICQRLMQTMNIKKDI